MMSMLQPTWRTHARAGGYFLKDWSPWRSPHSSREKMGEERSSSEKIVIY